MHFFIAHLHIYTITRVLRICTHIRVHIHSQLQIKTLDTK